MCVCVREREREGESAVVVEGGDCGVVITICLFPVVSPLLRM